MGAFVFIIILLLVIVPRMRQAVSYTHLDVYKRQALEAAYETGAAAPAVPVKDTVKVAADGVVVETPAREKLYAVQTPQCFRTALYRHCLLYTSGRRCHGCTVRGAERCV